MRGNGDHLVAREALRALHAAVRALRERPDAEGVCTVALRRARHALTRATAAGPLLLELAADAVRVDGRAVLPLSPHEAPFAPLRAAGVGTLTLAKSIGAAAIEAMVRALAAVRPWADPDAACAAAMVALCGLPGVSVHAADDVDLAWPDASVDWSRLGAPSAAAGALDTTIERDLAANLPALVVRQLLDEIEAGRPVPDGVFERLLDRMLEADDVGSAAWLLAEVQREPEVPRILAAQLGDRARRRCTADWLATRLQHATRDELLGWSALAVQLGGEAAVRIAATADAVQNPLAPWLSDVLRLPPQ